MFERLSLSSKLLLSFLPSLLAISGGLLALMLTTRSLELSQAASAGLLRVGVIGGLTVIVAWGGGILFALRQIGSLQQVNNELQEAVGAISSAAGEVAATSHSLSDGSSQQAAALQQTSASTEEVTVMTRQDAENAQRVDQLMQEADEVIGIAAQSMTQLTDSMQKISEASSETQGIVKTIDEIAFQTNLLALNAAVEAARAGEAGAGFAIVADEVRNLARRATEAAHHTSQLIEKTVERIDSGSTLVSATGESFQSVSRATAEIGKLMSDISHSTGEQCRSMEEANRALHAIDSVTQRNVSLAEEAAAASRELSSQSGRLERLSTSLARLVHGSAAPSRPASGKRAAPAAKASASAPPFKRRLQRPEFVAAALKGAAADGKRSNPPKATKKNLSFATPKPEEVIPFDDRDFQDF